MKAKILILAALSFMTTSSVFAASANANLNISGTIADTVNIVVTPDANATSLNLTTSANNVAIASVAETSNSENGYQIKAKSLNAGKLKHQNDPSQMIDYTIKYGASGSVGLTAADQVVKTQNTGANYNGVVSNMSISYTGVSTSTKKAGTYTDTITLTIEGL